MQNNQITWQTQDGKQVVVTIDERSCRVEVAGKIIARAATFLPVPAAAKAKAAQMGVAAFLGLGGAGNPAVAVTAENKALIETKRAELFPPQAPTFREPMELLRLEDALEKAQAWVLRHDANPAPVYAARDAAERALADWKAANPDAWAATAAHRQAERDAKDAQNAAAVQRALRGED